ncbi:hypothetical protein ROCKET24_166 [Vibrio phage Rocket24]|uniref:AAA family ATPase n=1 Tax=Vibrio phage Chester TaxID=2712961 RepID=A0A6G8R5C0_9CAUD|nr:ATPase [Vibrio phage Chester]QIG66267.1 hypothetical protein CILSICK_168 [Vibrio phage Cilsick]QQO89984.1 hypothetical protein ABURR_174 [Vibrio phage ABurr]WBU77148.1 hypothetical protein NOELLE_164 [Vibrio phage Noelle]WCD55839.1 hypothetical protein ROCKET24_166 [Vibrio phage Rocket24]QIN96573.1 hypothetical protein CHESTER_170 [Vibrio phage Chester]
MKKLYLIRGVSGSGKTTLAKEMMLAFTASKVSAVNMAADDYFMKDGKYNFDVNKLYQAHTWCKLYVLDMMVEGVERILVHNTFTTEKEMKPYLNLAEKYGYEVTTLVVENRHGNSSVHDVPDETLVRQSKRLRDNLQLI